MGRVTEGLKFLLCDCKDPAWPFIGLVFSVLSFLAFFFYLLFRYLSGWWPSQTPQVPPAGPHQEGSSNPDNKGEIARKRISWWTAFTASTATFLAITTALPAPSPWPLLASLALLGSVLLSVLKLLHWTHDDKDWIRRLSPFFRDGLVWPSLAVILFLVGVILFVIGRLSDP